MANLQGTTVTGDLAVTGAVAGQGLVPIGAVIPVVSALTGSHTIPGTGTVDADGWQLCDGAAVPSSQTLSGTTPDLTDGRFLRGFTSSSGCGGSATFTLALGNLAAHDHGGATTSASTTPGATGTRASCTSGGCGQTSASTTPGATGTRASCATGGCGQTTASTTPGATGSRASCATSGCGQTTAGCGQTTNGCGQTTSNISAGHSHTFTTSAQNCQHCHCICDGGVHSHGTPTSVCRAGWAGCPGLRMEGWGGNTSGTDGRHHCAEYTCCTYNSVTHLHTGGTATQSANHTHTTPSHSHTTPSHSHTTPSHSHTMGSHNHDSAAHTHTTPSHSHTMGSHNHDSVAHTHTTPSHTHTMGSHNHDSTAHTHSTTVVSAGSGTAKEHLPIYFNVKYLIRVI